jgi:uncharacterized protein (TIGR00369 family)
MSVPTKMPNPFLEQMGIKLLKWEEGYAEFEMPIQAWHMNRQAALQGGVVATLIDAACGYAGLYSAPGAPQINGVTITLNVNFVSSTSSGVLIAKAKKIGGGRKIFFSEAQVHTADGILIASGQASFKYRSNPQI